MSTENSQDEQQEQAAGTSRGEFLKWGTIALSGLYVGPRITTFAVQQNMGHAGSVPVPPGPKPPVPPGPNVPFFPATGGAAKQRGG